MASRHPRTPSFSDRLGSPPGILIKCDGRGRVSRWEPSEIAEGGRGGGAALTSAQTPRDSVSCSATDAPPAPWPACALGSVSAWVLRRSLHVRFRLAAKGRTTAGGIVGGPIHACGREDAYSEAISCSGMPFACMLWYFWTASRVSGLGWALVGARCVPCIPRGLGSRSLQVGSRPTCHCGSAPRCHRPWRMRCCETGLR